MGRRSSKKNSAMLDSDDTGIVSSSPSISHFENMLISGVEEVHLDNDPLLDRCLEDLYEKSGDTRECRGNTRERALASFIQAFNNNLQHAFVDKN